MKVAVEDSNPGDGESLMQGAMEQWERIIYTSGRWVALPLSCAELMSRLQFDNTF